MKAGLRKAKREKLKLSQSNALNSVNESQSQAPGTEQNNEIIQKNLSSTNSDIIEINKNINTNLEKEDIKSLKSNLNPESIIINNNSDIPKDKSTNLQDYQEEEFSKIATMFNFEIDKEKDRINIKENEEYYDMRNQIAELEQELEDTKKEYDELIINNENEVEMQKEQIEGLENDLKRYVDYNIENLKKENIILLRDVNILDKKIDTLNSKYQKEKYDITNTISELDSTINKLKQEIYYVDDLKLRLKSLTSEEIPQELANSINFNFNIKNNNKETNNPNENNKFGIIKSKTGNIPIGDILDFSSIDSKRSVKKLYI
jgi:hypothetical protein